MQINSKEVSNMKHNKINPQILLSELDMALSEDYGCGLNLNEYPSINQLIEILKKEAANLHWCAFCSHKRNKRRWLGRKYRCPEHPLLPFCINRPRFYGKRRDVATATEVRVKQ